MALQIIAVLVLGLMCGSELNVAVFGHPTVKRQPLETHILVRSSFAGFVWAGDAMLDAEFDAS